MPAAVPLPGALDRTARAVLDLALARSAWPDGTRLVCVEGPAGSGKTSLAAAVRDVASESGLRSAVVHTDDVLQGWDGLGEVGALLSDGVVWPAHAGRPAAYRRDDWHRAALAERVVVPTVDLLLVEGVGSGHVGYADVVTVLVWVEAPRDVRRARGLARDGEALQPHWDAFVPQEDALHAREDTRRRADLVVDGVSGEVTRGA